MGRSPGQGGRVLRLNQVPRLGPFTLLTLIRHKGEGLGLALAFSAITVCLLAEKPDYTF